MRAYVRVTFFGDVPILDLFPRAVNLAGEISGLVLLPLSSPRRGTPKRPVTARRSAQNAAPISTTSPATATAAVRIFPPSYRAFPFSALSRFLVGDASLVVFWAMAGLSK